MGESDKGKGKEEKKDNGSMKASHDKYLTKEIKPARDKLQSGETKKEKDAQAASRGGKGAAHSDAL